MTTDPKKNDELRDQELQNVSGGAGKDKVDENPQDAPEKHQKPEQLR